MKSDLQNRLSAFLRRGVLLLSADGALTEIEAPGPFGRLFRKPLILLSRSLCHHQPYQPPNRLAEAKQNAAALLAAEVNPPFERSETLVLRGEHGFSIWSWNAELVDQLVGDRAGPYGADLEPESLHHRSDDGARIVALDEGFEAQGWQGGELVASLFVAGAMDDADWQTFLAMLGGEDAAGVVPPAESRAFERAGASSARIEPDGFWNRLSLGAGVLCAFLLVFGLYAFGQNLRLNGAKAVEQLAIARLDTARQGGSNDARVQRQITTLRGFRAEFEKPDPVALLAEAYALAEAEGLDLSAFTVDSERLRLGVKGTNPDALQAFALGLEMSPFFINVSPQTDRRSGTTFFLAEASGVRGAL